MRLRTLLVATLTLLALSRLSCGIVSALDLMNVWHIPTNAEPPTVTMRNPVQPAAGDPNVYLYVGGWPAPHITTATLHYKVNDDAWATGAFAYDSTQGNGNEYWIIFIAGPFADGDSCSYYIEATNPAFQTTFVYGTDSTTNTTGDESTAQNAPFTFSIGTTTTPTPVRSPTPNATPTPSGTRSPSATPRPSTSPTATGTPVVDDVSIDITTNQDVFHGGDQFILSVTIHSPGPAQSLDEYVVLQLGDGYWFWPSWRESPPDFAPVDIEPRHDYQNNVLVFIWPSGVGSISGITFYGALFATGTYDLIDYSSCECGAE